MQHPERRKDLSAVVDEAMKRVTKENIENYYSHQATIVTNCLRGLPLSPDTLKYNGVDDSDDDIDETYEQDTYKTMRSVGSFLKE